MASNRREMHKFAASRLEEIRREFSKGFEFLENYPKSVTFFGANRLAPDHPYCLSARALANRIAKELRYAVVTGGGPGIMGAANNGAYEAGGESVGILIKLPHAQAVNGYLTNSVSFHHFYVRKVMLAFSAEAFVFYPGGFGTLDEFFEILTLIQTEKVVGIPLICVGSEYWNKIRELMLTEMLPQNTIIESDLNLFTITDNLDEVIEKIRQTPVRAGIPFKTEEEVARALTSNIDGENLSPASSLATL